MKPTDNLNPTINIRYHFLEPEVAGGIGEHTVLDASCHPPLVSRLHYEFNGWLGDDILETFPCFIVTERLWKAILDAHLTGVQFEDVEVSKSIQFGDLFPGTELPAFKWMKVEGEMGKDDFVIAEDYRLKISDRALELLRRFQIEYADISF